jgi:hypothetical protein
MATSGESWDWNFEDRAKIAFHRAWVTKRDVMIY